METHAHGEVHWQARQASVATTEVLQAGALAAIAAGFIMAAWQMVVAAIAQNQVFELNGLAGDLGVYAVGSDGTLTRIATAHGLPAFDGSNGMEGDRGHLSTTRGDGMRLRARCCWVRMISTISLSQRAVCTSSITAPRRLPHRRRQRGPNAVPLAAGRTLRADRTNRMLGLGADPRTAPTRPGPARLRRPLQHRAPTPSARGASGRSRSSANAADDVAGNDPHDETEYLAPFRGALRVADELELRGAIGGPFTWRIDDGGPLLRHRAARSSKVDPPLLTSTGSPAKVLYRSELSPRSGRRAIASPRRKLRELLNPRGPASRPRQA